MQDYSNLFPKNYQGKKASDREQLQTIKRFLGAGLPPLVTILCIMIFLADPRR